MADSIETGTDTGDEAWDELESALKGDASDGIHLILNEKDEVVELNDKADESAEAEVEAEVVEKKEEDIPTPEKKDAVESKSGEKEEEKEETRTAEEILRDENAELRQMLREHRREMALLSAKVNRTMKKAEVVEDDSERFEDEGEETTEGKKTEAIELVEKYHNELNSIAEKRSGTFEEIVELMSLNPKFEDVKDVCTKTRFDDVFEAAAKAHVEKNGGDLQTAQLALEVTVWKMPNPYKYMYDIIKTYHPDFIKKETAPAVPDTKVKGVAPTKEALERSKIPAKAPITGLDVGGGGEKKNLGGWTAARIDAMDEMELTKVPTDVYDMYLAGGLD